MTVALASSECDAAGVIPVRRDEVAASTRSHQADSDAAKVVNSVERVAGVDLEAVLVKRALRR